MAKRKFGRCDSYFHGECRVVDNAPSYFDTVNCPWCDYPVSTNNIGKWCAGCYCLFQVDDKKKVHFGKGLEKSVAVAFAISLAKTGGAIIGPGHFSEPKP